MNFEFYCFLISFFFNVSVTLQICTLFLCEFKLGCNTSLILSDRFSEVWNRSSIRKCLETESSKSLSHLETKASSKREFFPLKSCRECKLIHILIKVENDFQQIFNINFLTFSKSDISHDTILRFIF